MNADEGLIAAVSIERHYSVQEIAEIWHLSIDAVRRMFEREPGVLVLGGAAKRKRRYRTLRIPESVLQRVHRRQSNPETRRVA